ncbi:MAG: Asp-tRNA(Asn)/Glu-tRNA(Gln) amidotransferase subunit GatC [Methanomicrobiales archaeon]|nr:Asp-tRNA(Asn)/Glu-tRNA(Gln) amidotransferase subunit GatC [Methanomicrobiales archaeon]
MVTQTEIDDIAKLADISIHKEELDTFTSQFNAILDYFDLLDAVDAGPGGETAEYNVFREDEVEPSLPQEDVLALPGNCEDGFVRAPRVM